VVGVVVDRPVVLEVARGDRVVLVDDDVDNGLCWMVDGVVGLAVGGGTDGSVDGVVVGGTVGGGAVDAVGLVRATVGGVVI
jgi:hypothetical protein